MDGRGEWHVQIPEGEGFETVAGRNRGTDYSPANLPYERHVTP